MVRLVIAAIGGISTAFASALCCGVYRAEVSHDSASAVVDYDPERTSSPQFIATLNKLTGYDAAVVREPAKSERS
jgi:hypothetical protein